MSEKYLALSDLTLSAIQAEATRARVKHGEHSMLGPRYSSGERLAILVEEVGEVAHELTYDQAGDRDKLVKELIQVAAMAASWVEYLEAADDDGALEDAAASEDDAAHGTERPEDALRRIAGEAVALRALLGRAVRELADSGLPSQNALGAELARDGGIEP